jgi:beta-galactosidase
MQTILLFAIFFSWHPSIHASCEVEKAKRTKTNLNENWMYAEINFENSTDLDSYANWENINLPHTWNSEDPTDFTPGYRRSASWYKKSLDIPTVIANQNYVLYFEGSNITTEVFVNGEKVGNHIGGYIGFEMEITNFIHQGENEILVRVDNGYNPEIIPSQKSDFFIYGGITRDVWLITTPKTHISNLKISTPTVSEKTASIKINATISNADAISNISLQAVLKNPSGKKVAVQTISVTDDFSEVLFEKIKNPELWDLKNPNLYTVEITLLKEREIMDDVSEIIGFRWFEFKEKGAFFLNGKRVLIRGTHRHEEHSGVGAAMTNQQHYDDLKAIKNMGANFVRLAHYPQDPEVYKACDELGLLVWDELPWCRGGVGNDVWQLNTKNMLEEMMVQNYNHPSIIIWGLGNEMYWLPDFENGGDPALINPFLEELNTLAHALDPNRKTAVRKYYEGANIVDVFSPSIWSGWYSGSYKSYQKAIDTYKKEYKHFIHAEYGGSSHAGRHTENPITGEGLINADGWEEEIVQTQVDNIAKIGDWSENYIVDLFDWHLRISELNPDFVGNVQWAFKDFGTPLRPENDIPYMNQKGLVDRDGNPKDAFYVFKSYWSEEPFVYIESHTWTERQGPPDKARTISVYSNCKQVKLFHNGKDLKEKVKDISKFPASGLTWDVNFTEGSNTLIAEGISVAGKRFTDSLSINYRFAKNEAPKELVLTYKPIENNRFLITAEALDTNGLRCLDYENKIYFQCLSGGETLKNQGTPTGSEVIAMANGKASIELIPDPKQKKVVVMVMNQDFKGTYLEIPTK